MGTGEERVESVATLPLQSYLIVGSVSHDNCGGYIHAVFICNARLFCMGKGGSKE
jgi:hypothetical protein